MPGRRRAGGRHFALGCPVADTVSATAGLRAAAAETFDVWQDAIVDVLAYAGIPAERAPALAALLLSALDGSIVMSRARRSLPPLDTVLAELGPLLDAVPRR